MRAAVSVARFFAREMPMDAKRTLEYAVIRGRGGWQVIGPNGHWRSFPFRVDAEEAALKLASQTSGGPARVLVQDPAGLLEELRAA